ncbi:MAG: hypothetical protein U9R41_06340 [Candidatus Marinimicrobia bacterium]|nr:hypothetical protein [Candidatus Neomarinimicrobiota bacterium]
MANQTNENYYSNTWSFIIKWVSIVLSVLVLLVIFTKTSIWTQEKKVRSLARWKMEQLWNAEELYEQLTGEYNPDLDKTLHFIKQVRDSIYADSLYAKDQVIEFNGKEYQITIPEFWMVDFDTSFAYPYIAKDTNYVKIFTAIEKNEETGSLDTVFLNEYRDRWIYSDSLWEGSIIDTVEEERIEEVQRYKPFILDSNMLIGPLTKEKFTANLKDGDLIIQSPTKGGISFKKYFFFTFEDTGHGSIKDGKASWNKK